MATMGTCKPALVLGLVVAALAMAAAQAATVTIYNPAGMVVNIEDDTENKRVEMTTAMITMEIPQEQQDMQISQAGGEVVDVSVRDGDVLVLIPDPADDSGSVVMAFKVVEYMAGTPVPEPADDIVAAGEPRASSLVHTATDIPPSHWDQVYTNRKMDTRPAEEPRASSLVHTTNDIPPSHWDGLYTNGKITTGSAEEPRASSLVHTTNDIPPSHWDGLYTNGKMTTGPAEEPRSSSLVHTANDIPPSHLDGLYTNRKMASGPAAAIQVPKPSTASIPAYDRAYNARLLAPVKPPGSD